MHKAIEGGWSSEEAAKDKHMEGTVWITHINHPICSRTELHLPLQLDPMLSLQRVINIHKSNVTIVRYLWSRHATGLTHGSPFLQFVSNADDFDRRLSQYITSDYVQLKWVTLIGRNTPYSCFYRYQQLLGCNNVNLTNTTSLYARYTTSVICNAIVQNSIQPCSLSNAASTPLCAETCVSVSPISERAIF